MQLIPVRAYLIAFIAAVALSCAGYFAFHERSVEHQKDVAVATKAVAKVEKKDATIEAQANTEIQQDVLIYKQAVAVPPVGDIGSVCDSSRRNTVPHAPAGSVGKPGADDSAFRVQADVFDPSGELLTVARSQDARIRELQSVIVQLQAEMAAAAKAHQ